MYAGTIDAKGPAVREHSQGPEAKSASIEFSRSNKPEQVAQPAYRALTKIEQQQRARFARSTRIFEMPSRNWDDRFIDRSPGDTKVAQTEAKERAKENRKAEQKIAFQKALAMSKRGEGAE